MAVEIIDTTMENVRQFGLCGYKDIKRAGYPEKLDWLKARLDEGLKIKTLYSDDDGTQGMIEYIPGEMCWRPVDAAGYLFIHCMFVGFKKEYKEKGYGSQLVQVCIEDARKGGFHGVAVVTRKGAFMAGNDLFLKNGFEVVDAARPDFNLLVTKFKESTPSPRFKQDMDKKLERYGQGLTIIRAYQCPYTVKNVNEIADIARNKYGMEPRIITLASAEQAQDTPCAYGVFSIILNGKLAAVQPISAGRFTNIMQKECHG